MLPLKRRWQWHEQAGRIPGWPVGSSLSTMCSIIVVYLFLWLRSVCPEFVCVFLELYKYYKPAPSNKLTVSWGDISVISPIKWHTKQHNVCHMGRWYYNPAPQGGGLCLLGMTMAFLWWSIFPLQAPSSSTGLRLWVGRGGAVIGKASLNCRRKESPTGHNRNQHWYSLCCIRRAIGQTHSFYRVLQSVAPCLTLSVSPAQWSYCSTIRLSQDVLCLGWKFTSLFKGEYVRLCSRSTFSNGWGEPTNHCFQGGWVREKNWMVAGVGSEVLCQVLVGGMNS